MMPKVLIAFSSGAAYEQNHQAVRETWITEAVKLGCDYKFFLGKGASEKSDVVVCESADDPGGMADRIKEKAKYTLEHGYDFVFMCYPDTYVVPERLLKSGFEQFDYFGSFGRGTGFNDKPYCHGGAGYFLSRKSCSYLVESECTYPNDDCWVGDTLYSKPIHQKSDKRFCQNLGSPLACNDIITSHLSDATHHRNANGSYKDWSLYDEHQQWLKKGN